MDNGSGLLQTLKLHTGDVTSCDLNLNYFLAIGSSDRIIRVLEWKKGLGFVDVSYSPLKLHKHGVTCVRFSPKGIMLASSSLDGTAVLFNVSTGAVIYTMVQYNTTSIRCCEFTFDSLKLITAGDDGIFCFWDLVHRGQMRNCQLHEEEFCVRDVAVSPDSEYFLSADSGNFLKVWFIGDVSDNEPLCLSLMKNVHDGIFSCDFSPVVEIIGGPEIKHKYVIATCGSDCLIKLWEVLIQRGENLKKDFSCDISLIHDLKGHANDILSLRFNSTGNYLLSTGLDNLIKLWAVTTGTCVETLQGHTSFGTCSAFSKDSVLLVTGSNDKTVIIWDTTRNLTVDSQLINPCNVSSHFTNVDLINYANKNNTGEEEKKFNNQFNVIQKLNLSSVINCVQIQGDILVMATGDKNVTIWKRRNGVYERTESVENHRYSINHLEISPCGEKVISSSKDGVIIFWDINLKLTHEMRMSGFNNSLRTCRFSPDSKYIVAAGDDQKVFLWSASNLEFIKVIQDHDNAVTSVAFTSDSLFLASTCCGGDIKLYSFEQDESVFVIHSAHDLGATCCDFSPLGGPKSGSTTAYSSCGTVSQNNYLLATCGNDSLVNLWEVKESQLLISGQLSGHKGVVHYVRFSPAEPFVLASCASDATIRIWHVELEQCLHILNQHQSPVTTCSFSEDSSLFATGSLDRSVLIWELTEQYCLELTDTSDNSNKLLQNWTVKDVSNWFLSIGYPEIASIINSKHIDGRKLLSATDSLIMDSLGLENHKKYKALKRSLHWLRKDSICFNFDNIPITEDIPHNFLCAMTHKIMKNPVICSDGYIYDKGAIIEWFLSGNLTSPMTKEYLTSTKLLRYSALKKNIYEFVYSNDNKN